MRDGLHTRNEKCDGFAHTLVRSRIAVVLLLTSVVGAWMSVGHDAESPDVGFLAFGDSGYSDTYLGFEPGFSLEELLAYQKENWRKQGIGLEEFVPVPMHRVAGTDFYVETSGTAAVASAMEEICESSACDLALMLGDIIYPDGARGDEVDAIRFRKLIAEPFQQLGQGREDFGLYASFGDHDLRARKRGREALLRYAADNNARFHMQGQGFYSFVRNDVEFFILDTNLLLAETTVLKDKLAPDGSEIETGEIDEPEASQLPDAIQKDQLNWFKKAISESEAHWKVVAGHHPLWSSGGRKFEQARALRIILLPTLCRYADLYLAGHEHDLEVHLDHCSVAGGEDLLPLPIIVSGATSKQRPINEKFEQFQIRTYADYETVWEKAMTWGFVHVALYKDHAVIRMATTPNSGSGAPTVEKTIKFPHRSDEINHQPST